MNTLLSQAVENIRTLKYIRKNQQLVLSGSRKLDIQDDYEQLENISELENGIHFSFHHILSSLSFLKFEEADTLIEIMDEALDNIFKNDKLNELMEDESDLFKIVDNIDRLLESYKESVYYKSPFYELQRNIYKKVDFVKDTFLNVLKKEEVIKRGMMFYLTLNTITGECDPNLIYTSDEEVEYETDDDINEENLKED
jgi:hypothetical protein